MFTADPGTTVVIVAAFVVAAWLPLLQEAARTAKLAKRAAQGRIAPARRVRCVSHGTAAPAGRGATSPGPPEAAGGTDGLLR
jgi:hypothetical protein